MFAEYYIWYNPRKVLCFTHYFLRGTVDISVRLLYNSICNKMAKEVLCMKAANKIENIYTVRSYETDFLQQIRPSSVLGLFQEIAGDHSQEMGLGFQKLGEQGRFWVLSKIYVSVDRKPKSGEKVRVATWPHTPNKAIYERSFAVYDAAGERLLGAESRWCILEKSGRIVPCSRIEQPEIDFIGERALAEVDWQIAPVENKGEPHFALTVANSEYDLNRHVNNIKYADYIFNCFTVRELEERRLRSYQLHYVKQAFEGDRLEFFREEKAPGVFSIEGVRNGAETVVLAQVRFA